MKTWARKGVWVSKKASELLDQLDASDINKIAVIRHAALGDMVLTRAFLIEARKAFPNAKITLSVTSNYTRGIPEDLVDDVHIITGSGSKQSIFSRISEAKTLGYQDIIFDLAASNRSTYLCLFTRAKLKIGFPYKPIQARLVYDIATHRSDLDFEVTDMLKMLNILGIKTSFPPVFDMPGKAIANKKPYISYFIGAAIPDKCWPRENYKNLIQKLATEYPDHDHVILEGLKEWENANSILDALGRPDNIRSHQANDLAQTVSFLKGTELLVSNDTGVRHLAIVSEVPTVGIFLADPFRYWPRFGKHRVVYGSNPGEHASIKAVLQECKTILNEARENNQD